MKPASFIQYSFLPKSVTVPTDYVRQFAYAGIMSFTEGLSWGHSYTPDDRSPVYTVTLYIPPLPPEGVSLAFLTEAVTAIVTAFIPDALVVSGPVGETYP